MSKTYMCELFRKIPDIEIKAFCSIMEDSEEEYFSQIELNLPLEDFRSLIEKRISDDADQNQERIDHMHSALRFFYAYRYINDAIGKMEEETGYCIDYGDELSDEFFEPGQSSLHAALNYNY